ncbi:MAG TPA: acyl-ACP--UDP-N-acetylglucosamine O-acyltransferase [Caulifigura sp.]|jgi:UDP-N-acetylglucosamine acyltransferase|nr:acyl-ACP--UDP-N-acetylglucosamine O-acyltransferase [Caulifigura sp.]
MSVARSEVTSLNSVLDVDGISPHAVVDAGAKIGANVIVEPFAVIKGMVQLGDGCHVHSQAVIGDVPQDRKFNGESSGVRVGEGTVIREGATIHRATGEANTTVVGKRCYLMTQSHVAHNCVIGNNVTLVSGALLGGHVEIDDDVIVGGNTGVHQCVRIGALSILAAGSLVSQDVPPFALTDRHGRVAGINLVGLRRAGYSSVERNEIKEAYRQLYRCGIPAREIVDVLTANAHSDAVFKLIEFLKGNSIRGLSRSTGLRTSHG